MINANYNYCTNYVLIHAHFLINFVEILKKKLTTKSDFITHVPTVVNSITQHGRVKQTHTVITGELTYWGDRCVITGKLTHWGDRYAYFWLFFFQLFITYPK